MGMKARMDRDKAAAEKAKVTLEYQKQLVRDGVNAMMPELTALARTAFENSSAFKDSSIYNNLTSDEINTDFARFQENGRAGRYDQEWQRQALAASERRAAGDMDEYQEAQFKEQWGESSETLTDDESDATLVGCNGNGKKTGGDLMASGNTQDSAIEKPTGRITAVDSAIPSDGATTADTTASYPVDLEGGLATTT